MYLSSYERGMLTEAAFAPIQARSRITGRVACQINSADQYSTLLDFCRTNAAY
jgi:hypothetical protein